MTSLLLCLSVLAADDLPVQQHTLAPSVRDFPRPSLLQFIENAGLAATRFLRPEPTDAFIIVPAIVGTVVALNTDIATHNAIAQLPNPWIGKTGRLAAWASYLGEGWVDLAIFGALAVVGGRDGQRAALAGAQALLAVAL